MKKKTIFVLLAILIIIICVLVFSNNKKVTNDKNDKNDDEVYADRTEIPTNIIENEIVDNIQSKPIQVQKKEEDNKKKYVEGQVIVVTDKSLESLKKTISSNSKLKDVKIETTVEDKKKNVFVISSDKYTL